jgi:protein-tyrosine phosphatase
MFDIHCHILSSIDDGARDIQESIDMCRIGSEAGMKAICATPHFIEGESEVDLSTIYERIEHLKTELDKAGISVELYPGMEVFASPNLVSLYEGKKIITLNNKNYMLIELPMFEKLPL